MACLSLQITKPQNGSLTLQKRTSLVLGLGKPSPAALQVTQPEKSVLTVDKTEQAGMVLTKTEALRLTVGEICSVSGGTLVVLAAKDGPLRTKNGGYLLLNPATNPPET